MLLRFVHLLCCAFDKLCEQSVICSLYLMRLAFRDFAFVEHCGIAYGLAVFVTAA